MNIQRLVLGDMQTNCYILWEDGCELCAVVDPAAENEKILAFVTEKGLKVKYIILTHVHIDHIQGLDELKKATGTKIAVHECEAELLNDPMGTLSALFGTLPPESKADVRLIEGDKLLIGSSPLEILHTPGHTVGGICILGDGFVISGDALFFESIGRTDFPNGSYTQLISSIKNKLFVLDDNCAVYPGHGEPTSIGHEKLYNPFI